MKTAFAPLNFRIASRAMKGVRFRTLCTFVKGYAFHHAHVKRERKKSQPTPTSMHLEVTTRCIRNCEGCYMLREDKKDGRVMELEIAREAILMGKEAGINVYTFVGGEPMTLATMPLVLTLVRENPDVIFFCCSNSFAIAKEKKAFAPLVSMHNMSIGLSIDGFEKTNDSIRGKDAFKTFLDAAEYLKSKRCFFGAVPTIRQENKEEVTSKKFLYFLADHGFSFVYYSLMQPSLGEEYRRLAATARNLPIYLHCNELGEIGELSPTWRTRIVYVAKEGHFLNDRRERIPIPAHSKGFSSVSSNENWLKKFR